MTDNTITADKQPRRGNMRPLALAGLLREADG